MFSSEQFKCIKKPVVLFADGKTDDKIHIGQYMN